MTYKGYKADIKFDSDANTFYGEILNSSAVIHFRGNSVECSPPRVLSSKPANLPIVVSVG